MKKINFILWTLFIILIGSLAAYAIMNSRGSSIDNLVKKETNKATENTTVKNGTYLIDGQPVTLTNGLFEVQAAPGSSSKQITRYFGNEATGDLNKDGKADVTFLLTQNTGDSGTFYYLAVALAGGQGYQGLNTILLGDKIAPQTTEIKEGKIIVNYTDIKSNGASASNPSVGVSRYFEVVNNQLVEINISSQITNRSWTWVNTKMNNDEMIMPKKVESFTLNFKSDGTVNGNTDCNSFFGKYEISGNKLTISSLGATMMFCDGSQESIFTAELAQVDSYLINKDNNLVLQLKLDSGIMIFK